MENIQLGIRGHDVLLHDPRALAAKIQDLGFQCVQLAITKSFPDLVGENGQLNDQLVDKLRQYFGDKHLPLAVLGCYTNIIHPDKETRKQNIDRIKNYLDFAGRFGKAVPVATETGSVIPSGYTTKNFTDDAFDQATKVISEICAHAQKVGATFAIEPGRNHPVYSVEKVAELIDRVQSPNLGVVLDLPGLLYQGNVDQQAQILDYALSHFGDRIVAFHLKDLVINDSQITFTRLGQGQLDYRAYVETVASFHPGAKVTFEGMPLEDEIASKQILEQTEE